MTGTTRQRTGGDSNISPRGHLWRGLAAEQLYACQTCGITLPAMEVHAIAYGRQLTVIITLDGIADMACHTATNNGRHDGARKAAQTRLASLKGTAHV